MTTSAPSVTVSPLSRRYSAIWFIRIGWPPAPISETCLTFFNCIRATLSADWLAISAPPSVYVGKLVDDVASVSLSSASLDSVVAVGDGRGFGFGCTGTGSGIGAGTGAGTGA